MAKPSSVFILTGNGNPESGKEYDSILVSVPSTSVNFLSAVRSLHPRFLTKSEPTFNLYHQTTPPAVVNVFVST